MLRRKPTAITITSEDITAFEEKYLLEKQQQQNPQHAASRATSQSAISNASTADPNDELKPLPGDKARIMRTRDERIGVTTTTAGSGGGARRGG